MKIKEDLNIIFEESDGIDSDFFDVVEGMLKEDGPWLKILAPTDSTSKEKENND